MAELDYNETSHDIYKYVLKKNGHAKGYILLYVFYIDNSDDRIYTVKNIDFNIKSSFFYQQTLDTVTNKYVDHCVPGTDYDDNYVKTTYKPPSSDNWYQPQYFIAINGDFGPHSATIDYTFYSENNVQWDMPQQFLCGIFFVLYNKDKKQVVDIRGYGDTIKTFTYSVNQPIPYKIDSFINDDICGEIEISGSYDIVRLDAKEVHYEVFNTVEKILGVAKKYDPKDPNTGGGDSKPSGGGGDGDIGGDTNPDDGLPTISALDSGLLTAYNPTVAELQSLGRFLWSDSFDISTFKKLFNDPFDTLLGLSVVPVKPTTSGTKSIMFGNMDSGVSAPVVANQWVPKDMGSVTLNEVWKGALDYAPSTGVTIYLPFIGMRQLNVNDVMGSTLHLIYKFDVLTGACIAQIYVNHSSQGNKHDGFSWTKDQGLLYEFIGQCAENIPLASQDFTNTIRAAIGGVAVATGAAASIATGNPALGIAGLTVGAANLGMQASTPTVERGGHLSGSASILGYSQPFLIVERPHQCKPSKYYALRGVPSQVYTSKLSNCTNFTQITANNNLHIAGATDTEQTELQNLLVAGVYFPNKKR